MRKHFLILMLMALLPLAGWASTNLNSCTIKFDGIGVAGETVAYTGNNLITAISITLDPEVGEDIEYDPTDPKFTYVWSQNGVEVNEIKNAGKYTVTVTGNGSDVYGDPIKKDFWVLKANNAMGTAPILLSDGGEGLDWAAAGYDLVTNANAVEANFGTVMYFVKGEVGAPAADAEGWTTTAPHKSAAGTYYVYYKVAGTDNYKSIAPALVLTDEEPELDHVVINGDPIPAGWVAPSAIEGLTFNNAEQELIEAGTGLATTYGKFMYKLGDGEWQEAVPTAKDVLEGGYTVSWKIVGNERYAGQAGDDIAGITIDPVDPNIVAEEIEDLTYTGKAQSLITVSTEFGATPTYTIAYKESEGDDYGEPTEVEGIANVTGIAAGFYKITATIAEGGNYNAAEEVVEDVEIAKATLTVSTKAATKVYGQDDPEFEITYAGLQNEETVAALIEAGKLTAPTIAREEGENVGSYTIALETDGTADNYEFEYDTENYAALTITPKDLNDDTPGMFTVTLAEGALTYNGDPQTKNFTIKYDGATVEACKTMATPTDYAFVYKNNVNAGDNAQIIITGQGNFTGSRIQTFAIGKKTIYIKPNNAAKTYGADDPTYLLDDVLDEDWTPATTADYKLGTLAGTTFTEDENAVLNGTVTLAREGGENVSSYKIYVKDYAEAAGDNYAVANRMGDPTDDDPANITAIFQINPDGDGLVLKFKDGVVASKTYGDDDPEYDINDLVVVSGLVGGDEWNDALKEELKTPTFAIHPKYQNVEDEENVLVVEGLASTNYPNVTVQPLAFTVNPRKVAVLVKPQEITYGDPEGLDQTQDADHWIVIEATEGDWKGNTEDVLYEDLTVTFSTKAALATYGPADDEYKAVIVATSENPNYVIDIDEENSVWGDLTVNPAGLIFYASDDDAFTKIKANDGQKVNVTIDFNGRTRQVVNEDDAVTATNPWNNWAANKWNALVLPFDITVAELSNRLGFGEYNYVVVNTIKKTTEAGKFQFELATGTIEANTPFMVKTVGDITDTDDESAVTGIIDFGLKEIKAPEKAKVAAEVGNGFKLVGEYTHFTLDKTTTGYDAGGNALRKFMLGNYDEKGFSYFGSSSKNSWTIVSFDGYVDLSGDELNARNVVFEFEEADGSTTAIKSVSADEVNVKAEGWYTINGVKLQNAPSQKGIYIFNGKKLVVK